jgi:hypothetical protein
MTDKNENKKVLQNGKLQGQMDFFMINGNKTAVGI